MAVSRRQIDGEETFHYVSARRKRERGQAKMQPPLTPMIDVTFQLLLFFLLVTRFPNEALIPGSIPEKGVSLTPSPTQTTTIDVIVRQKGQGDEARPEYAVRQAFEQPVTPASGEGDYDDRLAQGLYLMLREVAATAGEDTQVVIKPEIELPGSPYVRWEFVVNAYNQARRAEIKNVGFAFASEAGRGTL